MDYWRRGLSAHRDRERERETGFGNSVQAVPTPEACGCLASAFCKSPARLDSRVRSSMGMEGGGRATFYFGPWGAWEDYYVNKPQTNQLFPTLNCGSFALGQLESESPPLHFINFIRTLQLVRTSARSAIGDILSRIRVVNNLVPPRVYGDDQCFMQTYEPCNFIYGSWMHLKQTSVHIIRVQ